MAAVLASADAVEPLIEEVEGIEIAAINGPHAVTIAGPAEAIAISSRPPSSRALVFSISISTIRSILH